MKVYRLERHGFGPFTQYTETKTHFRITCENVEYKEGDDKDEFLYGTDDPDKLKEYFSEILDELLEVGFKLKTYNVPKSKVRFSPNKQQVAFHLGEHEVYLRRIRAADVFVPNH